MEASGIYGKSDIVDMQEMASWFIGHLELEASTNRRASTFWNEVAFWDVDAAQKEPLQGKMEFAGIGQLLDCDDLLLDALCAISVCSATNRPLSDIDAHFRSLGLEKRSIIESLRRNQDQNGFALVKAR